MLSELLTVPARQAATLEVTEHRPWPLPEGGWTTGADVGRPALRALAGGRRPAPPARAGSAGDRDARRLRLARDRAVRAHRPAPARDAAAPRAVRAARAQRAHVRDVTAASRGSGSSASTRRARSSSRPPAGCTGCPTSGAHVDARARWVDRVLVFASRGGAEAVRLRGALPGDGRRVQRLCPASLEHFLTERYCLYTVDGGVALSRRDRTIRRGGFSGRRPGSS